MERRPSVFIRAAWVSAVLIGPGPLEGLAAGGTLSRASNKGPSERKLLRHYASGVDPRQVAYDFFVGFPISCLLTCGVKIRLAMSS